MTEVCYLMKTGSYSVFKNRTIKKFDIHSVLLAFNVQIKNILKHY